MFGLENVQSGKKSKIRQKIPDPAKVPGHAISTGFGKQSRIRQTNSLGSDLIQIHNTDGIPLGLNFKRRLLFLYSTCYDIEK